MVTRALVVLPDDLMTELDELVGPRRRSQYVVGVVHEKLLRER